MTPEVSQLRGWLNSYAPCRNGRKHTVHTVRGGLRGPRGVGGSGRARCVHAQRACAEERARLQRSGGTARGAAHAKHPLHVRDAGGVPAERLVELVRVLPRVASSAHTVRYGLCAGRGGERRRGAWCVQCRAGKRHVTVEI